MSSISLNGNLYDSDTSFVGYTYITNLITMISDWMADAGVALRTTSSTSVTIATGSTSFTLAANRNFSVGGFVTVADRAAPSTNWMFGQVKTYVSATKVLTVSVITTGGSGSLSNWEVAISGGQGATGVGTLAGNATGSIDMSGNLLVIDGFTLQETGEGEIEDKGTITSTLSLSKANGPTVKIVLGSGTLIIDFLAPTSNFGYALTAYVNQDGTGGRDVSFLRAGATTLVHWLNTEPVWSSQAASLATRVVGQYDGRDGHLLLQAEEDIWA